MENEPVNTLSTARIYKSDQARLLEIVYAWQAQTGQKWTIAEVVAELVERYAEEIK